MRAHRTHARRNRAAHLAGLFRRASQTDASPDRAAANWENWRQLAAPTHTTRQAFAQWRASQTDASPDRAPYTPTMKQNTLAEAHTRAAWFATRQRNQIFPTTPDGVVAVWRFADGTEFPELTDGTCICPRTGRMGPLFVVAYISPDLV
jgi:hypothetical protein